jgi:ZIP family zinc transporter
MIHIGIISAVAIILHNIVEGMAVYSITTESLKVGLLVALGVGLHNIPMGMLMYSTLEKNTKSKRILMLALAAVSTFVGGVLMALISPVLNDFVIGILICLALGMLLYIILFELIPHLVHTKNKELSVIGILAGILVILISTMLE